MLNAVFDVAKLICNTGEVYYRRIWVLCNFEYWKKSFSIREKRSNRLTFQSDAVFLHRSFQRFGFVDFDAFLTNFEIALCSLYALFSNDQTKNVYTKFRHLIIWNSVIAWLLFTVYCYHCFQRKNIICGFYTNFVLFHVFIIQYILFEMTV